MTNVLDSLLPAAGVPVLSLRVMIMERPGLPGVPLAQVILVAILFRLVYYFIPFGISLGFYRSLLRQPQKP